MRYLRTLLLFAIVVGAPVPFGSVTPAGVLWLVGSIAVALALFLVSPRSRYSLAKVTTPLLSLLGLAALGIVQSLPWWGGEALSAAPHQSLEAAAGWAIVAVVLAIGAMASDDRLQVAALLLAAVVAAGFQALYGWRRLVVGLGEILGREVPGTVGRLRGTFVNSDHLAVLFEITLAVALAWGWWAWRRSRTEPRLERRLLLNGPPLLVWVGLVVALVATGSRAGLLAFCVAFVVQIGLLAGRRRWWWAAAALAGLVALAATVLTAGFAGGVGRQMETSLYLVRNSPRFEVWRPAWELFLERPLAGSGLGTFGEVFPRVQPASLVGARWDQAHNDPLELLVTGGLVAVLLLGWGLFWLLRTAWRTFHGRGRSWQRAAALAWLAAVPAVAVHELFDFGLTIPSNAVWMALLAGVSVAGVSGSTRAALRRAAARPPESRSTEARRSLSPESTNDRS